MEKTINIFLKLVRRQIGVQSDDAEFTQMITPEILPHLYKISKKHSMSHVVGAALEEMRLLNNDEISRKFQDSMYYSVMRYEKFQYERARIYDVLEKNNIPFVPLKGAVIKDYYPKAWLRSSGDIDILVKESEIERARELIETSFGYKTVKRAYHDICMLSPANICLELHFNIMENRENIDRCLKEVWNYTRPVDGRKCHLEMTPEYFMFHIYAHMSYHFITGGCGVRNFADIWLLKEKMRYNQDEFLRLCKLAKIDTFVDYADKISNIWFGNMVHDDVTKQMQEYIIKGGTFGTRETRMAAKKTNNCTPAGYLFGRIFMKYKDLCILYPKLEGQPFLYPVFTVKRWIKMLDKSTAKRVAGEVKLNRTVKQDSIDEVKGLFGKIGL